MYKRQVKHLLVRLDSKLSYWEQIKYLCSYKAAHITTNLSRLVANVAGPTANKRRLLMAVTESILLYGYEIWADELKTEKYRKRMESEQRGEALRVTSSYWTTPEPVVLVRKEPVVMALEQKHLFKRRDELGRDAVKHETTDLTLRHW